MTFDVFDIIAFVVFAVLLPVIVAIVVTLGSLPGRIAQERGHPQAAVISIASWVGVAMLSLGAVVRWCGSRSRFAMMGVLWPVSLSSGRISRPLRLARPSGRAERRRRRDHVHVLDLYRFHRPARSS